VLPVVLLPVVLPAIVVLLLVWLPGIVVCADADTVLKFITATPTTNTTATIVTPKLKVFFMTYHEVKYLFKDCHRDICTRNVYLSPENNRGQRAKDYEDNSQES
jgi:hypothetical protein